MSENAPKPVYILRWLRQGMVEEPLRDRRGWRIFEEEDVHKIKAERRKTYAGKNQLKITESKVVM